MLRGLDEIDWAALDHAYGPATDVPSLLRALLSPDPGERQDAFYELAGSICHQDTVYPATAAAVPFLYQFLTSPAAEGKDYIAYLLASIADGRGGLEVHAAGDFGEAAWREILAGQGKSLEEELAREAAYVDAVRRAVCAGLAYLRPYLSHPEPEVRRAVATALANCREHAAWARPALEAAMASETDEEVREALRDSRQRLAEPPRRQARAVGGEGLFR